MDQPGQIYRMPTLFGPSPGPRQSPGGKPYMAQPGRPQDTTLVAIFKTDGDALAPYLPEDFALAPEPEVTFEFRMWKDLPWLAGRGYNLVAVLFSVIWRPTGLPGKLHAVIWESRTEPILTGREEIGYPKLYAEIPDHVVDLERGEFTASAGWDGFTFLEAKVDSLTEIAAPATATSPQPQFQVKYVPATARWGEADVHYTMMTPAEERTKRTVRSRYQGKGEVKFTPAAWRDLPTMAHVVNALADVPLLDPPLVELSFGTGAPDIRGQVRLDPEEPRSDA